VSLETYAAAAAPPLSDAWYARLFAPAAGRDAVSAVLAFGAQLADCVAHVREPAVAAMKLAWWQEEIERLGTGEARHPITTAVAHVRPLADAPRVWLDLVDAAHAALTGGPPEDRAALDARCTRAGALHELLALVLAADAGTRGHARRIGAATAFARVVCTARAASARGRLELPLDALAAHGVAPESLAEPWQPEAVGALAALGDDARAALDAARRLPPGERPALRPALILAALQAARLERLARSGYAAEGDALGAPARLMIAWRAARASVA
jgi:phytoene synthase